MAEKKITKRESFTEIAEILKGLGKERLAGVMEHELELLAKKNASGNGKLTAVQVANNGIKEEILECMAKEPNRLFTISEMMKLFPCCVEMSNQRVSALVRQLKEEGKVERIEEKRKAVFRIAR
jgi:hypothetical protein